MDRVIGLISTTGRLSFMNRSLALASYSIRIRIVFTEIKYKRIQRQSNSRLRKFFEGMTTVWPCLGSWSVYDRGGRGPTRCTATVLSSRAELPGRSHGKDWNYVDLHGEETAEKKGGEREKDRWRLGKKRNTEGEALLLTRKRNNSHRHANRPSTQNARSFLPAVSTAIFVTSCYLRDSPPMGIYRTVKGGKPPSVKSFDVTFEERRNAEFRAVAINRGFIGI